MHDLVVVLPGILGSTLQKAGKPIWEPSAGAVLRAIKTLGRSIDQLTLPDGIGDDHPGDGVTPVALMPDLHVVPGLWTAHIGYDVLLERLVSAFDLTYASLAFADRPGNLLPVPYDWRLSNRYNGRRLKSIVEPALERWRSQGGEFADARVVFICHSMGGLIARWYIDREGGAETTRKLVTLGTPHRGALGALEHLVNGAPIGIGKLSLDVTRLARSLPSMHQLLPRYACIETVDGLVNTIETEVPELDRGLVADAAHFHDQLDEAWSGAYDFHPIVGFRQPTDTTARIANGRVVPIRTIEGNDEGGDATVPRLSATPATLNPDDSSIRSTAERHGALQSNPGVLDELEFILGARTEPYRAAGPTELSIAIDELNMAGEPIALTATTFGDQRLKLRATVTSESGHGVTTVMLDPGERKEIGTFPAGGYTVTVGAVGSAASRVSAVTCPILVWGE